MRNRKPFIFKCAQMLLFKKELVEARPEEPKNGKQQSRDKIVA